MQDDFGYRLFRLQEGKAPFPAPRPLNEGLLKGLGIYELGCDCDGDTCRAVYTLKLDGMLYVLHAFKKKSKSGISTPRQEMELIRARYQEAVRRHASLRASAPGNPNRM